MDDVAAFLELVPDEYVLADPEDLSGTVTALDVDTDGRVEAAREGSAPVDRARSLLAEASAIELLTPAVPDAVLDGLTGQVLDSTTTIEVVATGAAGTALTQGPLAAAQPMLMGRSDVSLWLHDGDAPLAVLLRPDRVAIAVVAEGAILALFESDGDPARVWAQEVYDVFRAEADQLV